MAAITTAVLGLGLSAYGAVKNSQATKKANSQQKKADAANAQVAGQNKLAAEASVRAEALRAQQMELEGMRRRRDIVRQAQGARALGLARATAQGAEGSSVQAGQQQVNSQQRQDVLSNLQNIMLGRGMFEENKNIYNAQSKGAQIQAQSNQYMSNAQSYMNSASQAQQYTGFGINLMNSAQTINNVGTTVLGGAYNLFGRGYTGSVSN